MQRALPHFTDLVVVANSSGRPRRMDPTSERANGGRASMWVGRDGDGHQSEVGTHQPEDHKNHPQIDTHVSLSSDATDLPRCEPDLSASRLAGRPDPAGRSC
jgi:hypothetical protein